MGRRAEGFESELLELGTEIARRRQVVGMTQPQLAQSAGLSLDGLLRVEKARSAASVVTLLAIADALGCPVTDLFQTAPRARSSKASDIAELLESQPEDVVDAALTCVRAIVRLTESRRP